MTDRNLSLTEAPLDGLEDTQSLDGSYLLHRVAVARRAVLSEDFVRLTLTGPSLVRFADPGLDQRIKLILPAAHGTLDLPFTDDWYAGWRALPDVSRPVIRTYTTRAVRRDVLEVDIDVVLHDPAGPAARFAAHCASGDEVILVGPNTDGPDGGGIDFRLPAGAHTVLLAGDETALPAIARILEDLDPRVRGVALVEVPSASSAALVPQHPGIRVTVLDRDHRESGALLVPAVHEAAAPLLAGTHAAVADEELPDVDVDADLLWEVPGDDGIGRDEAPTLYAWLAGEAAMIKVLRRHLVRDLGMDRRAVAFLGYWRRGKAELN